MKSQKSPSGFNYYHYTDTTAAALGDFITLGECSSSDVRGSMSGDDIHCFIRVKKEVTEKPPHTKMPNGWVPKYAEWRIVSEEMKKHIARLDNDKEIVLGFSDDIFWWLERP